MVVVVGLQIQESYQIMELPEQTNLVKKKETTETDTRLIPDIGVNKTIKFGKNLYKRHLK